VPLPLLVSAFNSCFFLYPSSVSVAIGTYASTNQPTTPAAFRASEYPYVTSDQASDKGDLWVIIIYFVISLVCICICVVEKLFGSWDWAGYPYDSSIGFVLLFILCGWMIWNGGMLGFGWMSGILTDASILMVDGT
jgi:hypothetical protein